MISMREGGRFPPLGRLTPLVIVTAWGAAIGLAASEVAGQTPPRNGVEAQASGTGLGAPSDPAVQEVPLYNDLGSHSYPISTGDTLAQRYFDQGLRLYYAFNHDEAIRSFRAAQALDPQCAMCWWGEALAFGPNINLPMTPEAGAAAYAAVEAARAIAPPASRRERDMIEALAVRYSADPSQDRPALDQEYAREMGILANRYPDDPDIAVLHAEALMDLSPWDYWLADGSARPWIATALGRLTGVLEVNPDHPGACHFFIHAVEELYPERAVPCAERLAGLMPGAGHIVHMPGHIYIRVGRYADAVALNRHAIHADETYIQDQRPGLGMYTVGYYPHNYDFLAFAAMMIGRQTTSLEAADRIASIIQPEMFGTPGMDFLQHWALRPMLMRVRFEAWDEVLEVPRPPQDLPHTLAIWHYVRGRALLGTGDTRRAAEELQALRALQASGDLEELRLEFNPSPSVVAIAERILTGRLAAATGRYDEALTALREAVAHEDGLNYGEPPEWSVPARQDLGEVALAAGRLTEAEAAFTRDLDRFPLNAWSLAGLHAVLVGQGRTAEAALVAEQFRQAWEGADARLPAPMRR